MTNVSKHARATSVQLDVVEQDGRLRLRVEDDGRGFDADAASSGGFGLLGMRERVALAGGDFAIAPAQPGTRVTAELPVRFR
jgi:signal transduction histidine kinase